MAKIALSDAFMFVNHCDYQPRSWHSHNYIRSPRGGKQKLIVPVIHKSGPSINEKVIDGIYWKRHHLNSIKVNYRSRPFFDDYYPELEAMLLMRYRTLAELNVALIFLLCHWLKIDTPIYFSENWNIRGHKTEMLADMCHKVGATDYLSSPGEVAYIEPEKMNGFAHHYLKFEHPVYEQGRPFIPYLSTIDLLFNCGPRSGAIVRGSGHVV